MSEETRKIISKMKFLDIDVSTKEELVEKVIRETEHRLVLSISVQGEDQSLTAREKKILETCVSFVWDLYFQHEINCHAHDKK